VSLSVQQILHFYLETIMKTLLRQITSSAAGFDTLPVRVAAGVIFAAHGAQKLFGWFGGYGLEGTGGWMASIGLEPGVLMAALNSSAAWP
jgi:putative oxidoreductase